MIGKPGRVSMFAFAACHWATLAMSSLWAKGSSELRIDYGPGYRVYYVQRGQTLVILLAGGEKHTQDRDIETALELAREL